MIVTTQQAVVGTVVTGVTTIATDVEDKNKKAVGLGDYLIIPLAQDHPADDKTKVNLVSKISGVILSATAAQTAQKTVCSYSIPFKVGVHFDGDEAVATIATTLATANAKLIETFPALGGSGRGFQGFYLDYFQSSC